jgi:hydrogenase-4 membrane subunit HyfE
MMNTMSLVRPSFAALQLALLAVLAWVATLDTTDSSWLFLGITLAVTASLGLSWWAGRALGRVHGDVAGRSGAMAVSVAQWVTLCVLAGMLLVAPLAIFGEVVFEGIG